MRKVVGRRKAPFIGFQVILNHETALLWLLVRYFFRNTGIEPGRKVLKCVVERRNGLPLDLPVSFRRQPKILSRVGDHSNFFIT